MDSSAQTVVLMVAGIAIVAWLMKSFSGSKREDSAAPGDAAAVEALIAGEDFADGSGGSKIAGRAPMSTEGIAFVPRSHGILLLPLVESEETPDWLARALDSSSVPYTVLNDLYFSGAGGGARPSLPGITLVTGDVTAARVVRGAGGADPWRLETIGRDGDFGFHPFATREGAEAALELLVDHEVVQSRVDEDGNSVPASPEDFEEARRRYEQTESELAIQVDDDEPPREGQWVSDRR